MELRKRVASAHSRGLCPQGVHSPTRRKGFTCSRPRSPAGALPPRSQGWGGGGGLDCTSARIRLSVPGRSPWLRGRRCGPPAFRCVPGASDRLRKSRNFVGGSGAAARDVLEGGGGGGLPGGRTAPGTGVSVTRELDGVPQRVRGNITPAS